MNIVALDMLSLVSLMGVARSSLALVDIFSRVCMSNVFL